MPTLSLLLIFYFTTVIFNSDELTGGINNLFLTFYDIQIRYILNHKLFFLGVLAFTFFFLHRGTSSKTHALKKYLHIFRRVVGVIITASFASFIILFFIAIIQLNVLSFLTYSAPNILGIETDVDLITDKLKSSLNSPYIITGGKRENKLIPSTLAVAQSGKNSFYGSRIIQTIPSYLVLPPKYLKGGVLMAGDTLIITEINSSDFQKVSPVMGYLMIKSYFPDKDIKYYPKVAIMDKEEYIKNRSRDFSKKLDTFDEVIIKISENINSVSESVEDGKNRILQNQERLKNETSQKEKEYTKCINSGYYESGIYYRTNTKDYCQEQIAPREEAVSRIKEEGEELESALQKDLLKLEQYKDYIKLYSSQKLLTLEESGFISYEFGTFNPPDEIKITTATQNNPQALADYFDILIHEYLHYATFDEKGKKIISSFFEESLTEYFAKNIVKDYLGVDTNLSYPVNIKIITQMSKRISDSDWADIYFSNDQEGLEKLLDRVYGRDFYKNNIIALETLQYLSDRDRILKSAGEIMAGIGGTPLEDKDINTTLRQ